MEMSSLSWTYVLHLELWIFFVFRRFSACLWLSTLTSKFPFLIFFTFFGVACAEIIFSLRNGENLARQTSSRDSMTMNLEKSAASFSESDSDKFLLVFFIKRCFYFCWSCSTMETNLRREWIKGETICLGWDRGCTTSILISRAKSSASAKFWF